jgi:capsular exopolysaccharide synthesis family protein
MELVRYFSILRKWYRLIIFTTLLAGATAFVLSSLLSPIYEAEADMAIVRSSTELNFDPKIKTVSESDFTVDLTARRKALTNIVKSPEIAEDVIAKLGTNLDSSKRLPVSLLDSIAAVNDGELIRIKAQSGSPAIAALLANTWAQAYQLRVNSIYDETTLSTSELQSQVDAAKRDYEKQEAALVAYLATNQIDQLKRQRDQAQQELDDLVGTETKIDRLLADARSLHDRLESIGPSTGPGYELAQMLLESSAFSILSDLPVNLQIPVAQLSTGAPRDEQLRNLEALIATLEDRRKAVQGKATNQTLQAVSQLQAQLEQAEAKQNELTGARDLAWSTYTALATKVAEVAIAPKLGGSVVRLAVPAVPPQDPIAPKKLLYTLFGSVLGFLLGVAIAFVFNYKDDSIADEDQAANLLNLPTIGVVPEIPKSNSRGEAAKPGNTFAVLQDAPYPLIEAFRLLQYNLLSKHNSWKVLMITSALPGEGKSTLASRLAVLMAQSGQKVILVDSNFRRPSQHENIGLHNSKGLFDILMDSTLGWETVCQSTPVEGLRVITVGVRPPNPTTLLQSHRLDLLIQNLKLNSDIVIVDTPAMIGLVDVPILLRVVDLIAMVVDSSTVSRRDVIQAKEILRSTTVPVAGVILNRSLKLMGSPTYEYYGNLVSTAGTNGRNGLNPISTRGLNAETLQLRARVANLFGAFRSGF